MKTAFSSRTCFTSKKSWPDRKAPGKTPMDFIEQYLRFIKEAERLKAVTRTAWTHDGRRESTAEHSWRLGLVCRLAAGRLPGLNREKVLMMSLIHDMGELYGGDHFGGTVPGPQEKTDEESRAVRKAFSLLPEREAESLLALWREYNANATPEARLVKALDKAETIIQHQSGTQPGGFRLPVQSRLRKRILRGQRIPARTPHASGRRNRRQAPRYRLNARASQTTKAWEPSGSHAFLCRRQTRRKPSPIRPVCRKREAKGGRQTHRPIPGNRLHPSRFLFSRLLERRDAGLATLVPPATLPRSRRRHRR